MQSPTKIPKPKPVTKLSRNLDKMVVKLIEELDVEALLVESTKYIKKGEYSENLLDDLLNNDDLLDEFQDDLAIVAIEFAD